MSLYHFDTHELWTLQTKVIDFGSIPELCGASVQAFLGFAPMAQMAAASKACHSFLYVALIVHRREELGDYLCVVCGWATDHHHDALVCDRSLVGDCHHSSSDYLCFRCLHVQGEEVLCLYCLEESHAGISDADRLLRHAWMYGCELHDAILGEWWFQPAVRHRAVYPFSVTDVVLYNANDHLPKSCSCPIRCWDYTLLD